MMYMQYKAQSFTDQEITLIYVLYTIISSVLHFEILFAISPQIDNFMRAGRLPN